MGDLIGALLEALGKAKLVASLRSACFLMLGIMLQASALYIPKPFFWVNMILGSVLIFCTVADLLRRIWLNRNVNK